MDKSLDPVVDPGGGDGHPVGVLDAGGQGSQHVVNHRVYHKSF